MALESGQLDNSRAMSYTLSSLQRKRRAITGQITSFTKFLDKYQGSEERDIVLMRAHLNGLTETWKRFDDILFEIEGFDETETDHRYEIQNTYYATIARAYRLMSEGQYASSRAQGSDGSPTLTVNAPMAIKLPEVRLPTFDGTSENWASFYDAFSAMIDRNEDLTAVQKLQYLRSRLTGRAAACIESLGTTEANYADAIAILENEFNYRCRVTSRHADAIDDTPTVSRDTPESLGRMVHTIENHPRAFENLEAPVASWDVLPISMTRSKTSPDTTWHRELSSKDRNMPFYAHPLESSGERANRTIIKSSTPLATQVKRSETHKSGRTDQPRKHDVVSAKAVSCPICKGSHYVRNCSNFISKSVKERITEVAKASLCPNCLRKGHNQAQCRGGTCRVCHKRHHTLLHNTRTIPDHNSTNSGTPFHTTDSSWSQFRRDPPTSGYESKPAMSISQRHPETRMGHENEHTGNLANHGSLVQRKCFVSIEIIDTLTTASKQAKRATIQSTSGNYERTLTFPAIPSISPLGPEQRANRLSLNIPRSITLTDFHLHCSAAIDVLLNARTTVPLLNVRQINLTALNGLNLYLRRTRLGWVIGGSAPQSSSKRVVACNSTTTLQAAFTRFRELEEEPQTTHLFESDKICKAHFVPNSIRNSIGSNFAGASHELRVLRELLQSLGHRERVQSFLTNRAIEWHFIPPHDPHFGGLWKAAIKSFKRHVKRVAGATLFTFENRNTLSVDIGAIFNSRPLTPSSSDPNELLILTLGYFLIGESLMSLRERDFRDILSNRSSYWHREYLNQLTNRSKWSRGNHPIKEGTIVLLREDYVPPIRVGYGQSHKDSSRIGRHHTCCPHQN